MKSLKIAKARGFSLIELLLVIGFISGALVLAFVTYPKVQSANRANVEAQHLIVMSGGIKNLYATAQSFNTLTNTVLVSGHVIPDDLKQSGGNISNIWGGNVTIVPFGTQSQNYTIAYENVPSSECSKLATSVAVNFLKLTINSSVVFDRSYGANVALDPANAVSVCAAGTGGNNTMTFLGN